MENRPDIQAITIDLDDTLWSVWPTIREAEKILHAWMCEHAPVTAAACSIEQMRAHRYELEKRYPEHQHNLRFYRQEAIRQALKQHGDEEALAEEAFHVFFKARQNVTLFDDVLPALKQLSSHYPIVAISNGNANLKTIGIAHFFKDYISAQHFGVKKPDPKIFFEAARLLAIDTPAHILHVGDDFELDILAAKKVGFKTAWVKRPELNIPDVPQNELSVADFIVTDLSDLCKKIGL